MRLVVIRFAPVLRSHLLFGPHPDRRSNHAARWLRFPAESGHPRPAYSSARPDHLLLRTFLQMQFVLPRLVNQPTNLGFLHLLQIGIVDQLTYWLSLLTAALLPALEAARWFPQRIRVPVGGPRATTAAGSVLAGRYPGLWAHRQDGWAVANGPTRL